MHLPASMRFILFSDKQATPEQKSALTDRLENDPALKYINRLSKFAMHIVDGEESLESLKTRYPEARIEVSGEKKALQAESTESI